MRYGFIHMDKSKQLKVSKGWDLEQPSALGCSPDWQHPMLCFHMLPRLGHQLHSTWGVKQGAGIWGFIFLFLVLPRLCLLYLFTACHPSPAGKTSLFIVLWCSEDVCCCYSCLVADDREFMLLMMRQERVAISLVFEGKRDFPLATWGRSSR